MQKAFLYAIKEKSKGSYKEKGSKFNVAVLPDQLEEVVPKFCQIKDVEVEIL